MKAFFTKDIIIGTSKCDAEGKLALTAPFTLFQDAASEHAEILGVGFADMQKRASFWTTVRTRLHFYGKPAIMDNVQVETWPCPPGATRCDRAYRLRRNGETLIEGKPEWCVFDLEKKSVKPVAEAGFREDMEYIDETVLPGPYARFRHNFADEDCAHVHIVRTSDIDVGRHMNNVAYLRAIIDSFRVAELEQMNVTEMEIMFMMPCFEGEELQIMRRKTEFGYEFGVRRPDKRYAALALMKVEE